MVTKSHYYLMQLVVFFCISLIGLLSTLAVYPSALTDIGGVLNIFVNSLQFVLLSHFVIRFPYKRLQHRFAKRLSQIILILCLSMLASVTHSVVKLFKFESQVNQQEVALTVKAENGEHRLDESRATSLQIGSYFILFTLWSVCYLVATGRRNERQMMQKLQEQQLENLMAQLNPHFLFNSMNTIRALIYEDRDKAADMVTQLSELFRYNLSSGTKTTVTLQDELDICQRYLQLEKNRLGERLNVEFEISPELSKAKLPGMAVFTLIENAVKHGIAPLTTGGKIHLSAIRLKNEWSLSVRNPFQAGMEIDGTRIGLNNLSKRLELMFGRSASFKTSIENNEFVAQIKVPYDA